MWLSMTAFIACGLFVMAVSTIGSSTQVNDTYYYSIEVNLETIKCKMCQPGTYWKQHCTQDGGEARCEECDDGRFTENYNRAIYCKRCTECRGTDQPSGEAVAVPCTRFNDTMCECKAGYWREEGKVGDCQKKSPCKPGDGVIKMGLTANSRNDTTCERCVDGKTFSNTSSEVTPCQNCSLCLEGWMMKFPCNETGDTVCIPKGDSHKSTTVYGNTFSDISTDQNPNPKSKDVKNDRYGVIVGVACGVLVILIVAIALGIGYCIRKQKLQWLPCRGSDVNQDNPHCEQGSSQQRTPTSLEMTPLNKIDNVKETRMMSNNPNNPSHALLKSSLPVHNNI